MNRVLFSILLLATVSVSAAAQDVQQNGTTPAPRRELTLEMCRDLAMENNPYILNAALDVRAAQAQKQEALAEYFPSVSATALSFYAFDPMLEIGVTDILGKSDFSYNLQNVLTSLGGMYGFSPVFTGMKSGVSATVSVIQPVFAGGRIVNGNRLAGLGVEAAGLQQSIKERDVRAEVESGWWQVISLQEKMKTLEGLQELVDTLYKDVSSACAAGLATENDLLQVQLRRNELASGRIQLKNGIRLAKMSLFNSIGVEYNPYSTIPNDSIPYIDDIVLREDTADPQPPEKYYRPEEEVAAGVEEARLLELSLRSKQLEKQMVLGEALPQIGVGASYGYGNLGITDGRFNGAVFATVKIPISDWGKTARKLQRYEAQVQKAANEKDYLDAQLVLQVRKLWIDLTSAWDQLQIARESTEVAQKSVESLTAYYKAGMSPLSELLQAQTQLMQASNAYADQCIAYRTALRAYLDRAGTDN